MLPKPPSLPGIGAPGIVSVTFLLETFSGFKLPTRGVPFFMVKSLFFVSNTILLLVTSTNVNAPKAAVAKLCRSTED